MTKLVRMMLVGLLASLIGCSSVPQNAPQPERESPLVTVEQMQQQALMAVYQEWEGVPYRLGGSSKKGIDCSAFVSMAYANIMGLTLPRTVGEQRHLGVDVARDQLQSGDLVFFKTGRSTLHVGIYLSQNQFLHASTSQGVIISSLNNSYWATRYKMAKRLVS